MRQALYALFLLAACTEAPDWTPDGCPRSSPRWPLIRYIDRSMGFPAWDKIAAHFTPYGTRPPMRIADLTARLGDFFAGYFGDEARRRLALPTGYAAFLRAIETSQISQTVGGWDFCLYGPNAVLANTRYSFELFGRDEDAHLDVGLWIEIGSFNDKHTFFLCCDRDRPEFRQIIDGHDAHPWLNGVGRPDYRSIEALLRSRREPSAR